MSSDAIAALLAALPQPALLIAGEDRIVGTNRACEELLSQSGFVGLHLPLLIRQPAVLEAVLRCRSTRAHQEARLLVSEGRNESVYQAHCSALELPFVSGVLICFEDITEAEAIGQMRRDFVANVSHELRTPLTALMGFIETLQGPAAKDEAARIRFLGIMAHEAGRMNRLVSDLLSLSRVEAGARSRPTGRLDLAELIRSASRSLQPLAEKAGVRLVLQGMEAPQLVQGEADQLRQVMANLVENAIKYGGNNRTVTLELSEVAFDPSLRQPCVRLEVRDEGPGIDPLHLPRLTERFYRVDSHRSREVGGTGLGLAIVKHIVNRHRGRLKISSTLGSGSSFAVFLPKAA